MVVVSFGVHEPLPELGVFSKSKITAHVDEDKVEKQSRILQINFVAFSLQPHAEVYLYVLCRVTLFRVDIEAFYLDGSVLRNRFYNTFIYRVQIV